MSKISQDIILNATIDKKVMNIDTTVEKDPVAMDAYIDKGSGGVKEIYHDETIDGKGTKDDPLGVNTEVIATKEDLESKQDKLTAGANIKIEDNVISSTAQESFFRGRYATWTSVPTTGDDYTADFRGDKTPSYNDYIVVEDSSLYIPQDFLSDPNNVMIRNLHSAGVNYTIEVSIHGVVRRIYWTAAKDWTPLTDWLSIKYEKGGWQIKTVKEFYLNNEFMAAANGAWLLKNETSSEEQFYLSETPGVAPVPIYGSWRFVYHGNWAEDNKNGWKPEYQIEEVMPIATETQAGINRTYTAGANIRIEDNVISSTAQESFFRGRFAEWTSVPTSSADYTADFHGNTTPSYNDYIVVEDSSLYIPQDFLSDPNNVMIRNLHSAGVNYTIEVVIQDQIRRIYYTECTGGEYAQINDWLSVTYVGGAPGVWYIKTNKEFYINNVFTPTANRLELLRTNTPYETNFYLSEEPGVAPLPIYGSWRFVYHGVWADDNILGWKPEYQVEETLPMASDTQAGIAKLYKTSGSNTDGAMTQRAVGSAISAHNTATNAHSNIRGVAGGLATLDNNAKVPMSQINDALLGNVSYQGLWNAAENVPFLADPSGDIQLPKGDYYITSVAGDRFGLHFDVGDWIISTGEGWTKVDNTDAVVAVNGRTGNVVLNANDVNAYNKTEIDDKFAEVNTQINANTEAIADVKDDINDLQTQINTRTRVIIRRWE